MAEPIPLAPFIREREARQRDDLGCMIMARFKGRRKFEKFLIEIGRGGVITFRDLLEITEEELFARHPLEAKKHLEFVSTVNRLGFSFKQKRPEKRFG